MSLLGCGKEENMLFASETQTQHHIHTHTHTHTNTHTHRHTHKFSTCNADIKICHSFLRIISLLSEALSRCGRWNQHMHRQADTWIHSVSAGAPVQICTNTQTLLEEGVLHCRTACILLITHLFILMLHMFVRPPASYGQPHVYLY